MQYKALGANGPIVFDVEIRDDGSATARSIGRPMNTVFSGSLRMTVESFCEVNGLNHPTPVVDAGFTEILSRLLLEMNDLREKVNDLTKHRPDYR